ncbi:MAG: MFS transporter [Lachnospiraceae bacterium]|nr:MFS transporter [Lachnospiraceae bacterium]
MNDKNVKGLKLAVLTMCCLNLTSMIISPTLPGVLKEYPEVSITWIQNLSVMSSLTAVFSAQASGYLMKHIRKRDLAMGSFILYLLTGLSIMGTTHFISMVLLRCVNGFALGLNSTLSTSMIAEYFSGEERKRIMGYRMPFQNITAMFFSSVSGVVSQLYGWRYSYLLFLVALLPLTLGVLYLPVIKTKEDPLIAGPAEDFGYGAFFRECRGIVFICLIHMLAVLATGINSNNISLLVTEKGMGDSRLGGMITAVYLLSASVAGIFFGRINQSLERKTYPLASLLTVIGLFCSAIGKSIILLLLSEILVGFWWSTFMARMNVTLACVTNDRTRNIVFSFFMATMNLGTFINPYVSTRITDLMGTQGAAARIMAGAMIMVIVSMIVIMTNKSSRMQKQSIIF